MKRNKFAKMLLTWSDKEKKNKKLDNTFSKLCFIERIKAYIKKVYWVESFYDSKLEYWTLKDKIKIEWVDITCFTLSWKWWSERVAFNF